MLLTLSLMTAVIVGTGSAIGQAEEVKAGDESAIVQVKGKDSAARDAIYEGLRFNPDYMYTGKVLTNEPYAVVTEYNADNVQAQAKIKVWTGVFFREGNSLGTSWDELWIGRSGNLTVHATDIYTELVDYFLADSQKVYQTAEYLGKAPWPADIPTDKEAQGRQISSVPADGIFNFYKIKFDDSNIQLSADQQAVKAASHIPDFSGLQDMPADVKGHWAQDPILQLLRGKVIQGYEDHTVRPNNKLSRAEFIAIMVRSLKLDTGKGGSSQFSDVKGHWSEAELAAAERVGIVPAGSADGKFQPDRMIKRIEMVEFIDRAVGAGSAAAASIDTVFGDVSGLSAGQKQALSHVYSQGLIGGYPDGTFKPGGTLTRAEAFKVIAGLLHVLKS